VLHGASSRRRACLVLPTHRLLKEFKLTNEILEGLKRFFDVIEIQPTIEALDQFLKSHFNEHASVSTASGKLMVYL